MLHQSVEKLRTLRLTGMARALEAQLTQADIARLSFDERLAILIDREEVDRHNAALSQRLRLAITGGGLLRGYRLSQAARTGSSPAAQPGHRSMVERAQQRSGARQDRHGQRVKHRLSHWAIGRRVMAIQFATSAYRVCLTNWRWAGQRDDMQAFWRGCPKVKPLIPDDWLMTKLLTADQRRDLMEVIDDRHQRGSTVLATQIPLDCWHEQIGDPTYGDAILDRLVHNAYRIELRGPSMRPGRAKLSTDEKVNENKDISEDIPVTHTTHKPTASTAREDC